MLLGALLATSAVLAAATTVAAATPPAGYTLVDSGAISAGNGQTNGSVSCPASTVPLDGGADVSSTSLLVNLDSTYPTATGWDVVLNNVSRASVSFDVWAVCSAAPSGYVQQSISGTVVANTASGFGPNCPSGLSPTGGGALVDSTDTSVNVAGTYPTLFAPPGWETDFESHDSANVSAVSYVICGQYPASSGWVAQMGAVTTDPADSQADFSESCPAGLVVLGGGFQEEFGSAETLNSTYPGSDTEWTSAENNSGAAGSVVPWAVCAGTSPNAGLPEAPGSWSLAVGGGAVLVMCSAVRRVRRRLG
ncbi:MAG: hypothetical protein JOY68_07165 [Candidatus Dormibacteraeota bacterium]|nr:hypothetical protein [Candidatus Dormibacteraeota bacterium]